VHSGSKPSFPFWGKVFQGVYVTMGRAPLMIRVASSVLFLLSVTALGADEDFIVLSDAPSKPSRHPATGYGERSTGPSEPEEFEAVPAEDIPVEEAVGIDDAEIGMSWVLLFIVAGVMTLFYLVNAPDDDIRRYSWRIISSTVSIFVAVLMYQAVSDYLMLYVPREGPLNALALQYLLFMVLFVSLQICIAITSGANCEASPVNLDLDVWCCADTLNANYGEEVEERLIVDKCGTKGIAVVDNTEVYVQKAKRALERRMRFMKSNATIIAHMAGFAAIRMGGQLMHMPWFSFSWPMCAVSVFLNQVFLYLLFRLAAVMRKHSSGLDGTHDLRDHIYDEEVHDAENDISGLSISFLLVQVMRFAISGVLPESSGAEPHHAAPKTAVEVCVLLLCGMLAAILAALLPQIQRRMKAYPALDRPLEMLHTVSGMIASWTTLWASQWIILSENVLAFAGGLHTMAGEIIVAAALSMLSLIAIHFLDKIEDDSKMQDQRNSAQNASRFIQSTITSLAIMIGFSWEHVFDNGVIVLADLTPSPHITKLWMALIITLTLTPAWRMYILDKEMVYDKNWEEQVGASSGNPGEYEHLTLFQAE